jgi:hypothetical protein
MEAHPVQDVELGFFPADVPSLRKRTFLSSY